MRYLNGLGALARALEEAAVVHQTALGVLAEGAAEVMHHKAHNIFGDNTKLRDLEPSTQDERDRLGYSRNDPLYRDGTMLQASVEKAAAADGLGGAIAGIGSGEKVLAYHEFGYTMRTGRFVAPRPVFKISMSESAPEIEALVEEAVNVTFFRPSSIELNFRDDELNTPFIGPLKP